MPESLIKATTATIAGALHRADARERLELLLMIDAAPTVLPSTVDVMRQPMRTRAFQTAAVHILNEKRRLLEAEYENDAPATLQYLRDQLSKMVSGREAIQQLESDVVPELCDGPFIQLAHESLLGRGCRPSELRDGQIRLERGDTRQALLKDLASLAANEKAAERVCEAAHDPAVLHVMGTGERVTLADWQARAERLKSEPIDPRALRERHARFELTRPPRAAISAIASLYGGGRHIRRFMENITRQSCFPDFSELIIVDANSPDGEYEVVKPYLQRHSNIRYLRIEDRIGIYDAWNLAIEQASGEYITCTNVDDLRREDSLELQMTTLDALPFVDVVYQDFYYTFDPDLTYDEVVRFGVRARLPLVTRYSMLDYNPPHNAPMWRRRLHDELGLFDTRYQSAGDYDFWLRCVVADKVFHKLNDPHVVYYQNPEGLSTRPGTRGFAETRQVHVRRDREVISELLSMPFAEFCGEHLPTVAVSMDDGTQDRSRLCLHALQQLSSQKYRQPIKEAA